jgi:hypothetical protein
MKAQTFTSLLFVLVALMSAGCNLSRATPTPTLTPTSAFPTPIVDPNATPNVIINAEGVSCVIPPGWLRYVVESGDTMSLLAQQTGATTTQIADGNCLSDIHQLFVEQEIYLPRLPVLGS